MNLNAILPFLKWIPKVTQYWKDDIKAGLIVAIILIPQSMAYAVIAGMPAQFGLYASLIPVAIASLWSSTPITSTGPVLITGLLTFSTLSPLAQPGSPQYVSLALSLAIIVGCIQLAIGLFRLGKLIHFISNAVIIGFVQASAIIITISQLPKLLGLSTVSHSHFITRYLLTSKEIFTSSPETITIAIITIVSIGLIKRIAPKLPFILIVVALSILYSWLTTYTGGIVGPFQPGLPTFHIPELTSPIISQIGIHASIIALVGYMNTMSIAKTIAGKSNAVINPNQEAISQGLANLAAGLNQGLPVSASFSRTAVNYESKAKTPFAAVITALIVALILIFISPYFAYLPQVTLAAIIFTSVAKIINLKELITIYHQYKDDGIVAITTFTATLLAAPKMEYGIVAGVFTSFLLLLYRAAHPKIIIFNCGDYKYQRNNNIHFDHYETNQYALAVDPIRSLSFTNASYIEDEILKASKGEKAIQYVILMCQGINAFDMTSIDALTDLKNRLKVKGIILLYAHFSTHIRKH